MNSALRLPPPTLKTDRKEKMFFYRQNTTPIRLKKNGSEREKLHHNFHSPFLYTQNPDNEQQKQIRQNLEHLRSFFFSFLSGCKILIFFSIRDKPVPTGQFIFALTEKRKNRSRRGKAERVRLLSPVILSSRPARTNCFVPISNGTPPQAGQRNKARTTCLPGFGRHKK